MSLALAVPRCILVPLELCSVPPEQLDREVAAEATCALHIISSPMTPVVTVESSSQTASLCIPRAILNQGRTGAGKYPSVIIPQRDDSEVCSMQSPRTSRECTGARSGHLLINTGSMGCPPFLGSFPPFWAHFLNKACTQTLGSSRQGPCHALY